MRRGIAALVLGVVIATGSSPVGAVGPYDPVGDMQSQYGLEAPAPPSETVRDAQHRLRSRGYYDGPLDGVMTMQFQTAVWKFQRAEKLRRTGALDAATMAALGASPPSASPSTER